MRRAGAGHRLGDDLDQRDAGAVVVDERVVGAVDAPGRPDVGVLAGVLLEVHPLDADPTSGRRPRRRDSRRCTAARHTARSGSSSACPGRSSSCGRTGTTCDRAVQRQPDADRRLDRLLVGDRQRAGQTEADRAGLRVRLGAELGRAPAEHLGGGPSSTCVSRPMTGSYRAGRPRRSGSLAQLRDARQHRFDGRLERGGDAVAPLVGLGRRHDLQPDRADPRTGRKIWLKCERLFKSS